MKACKLAPEPNEHWLKLLLSLQFEAKKYSDIVDTVHAIARGDVPSSLSLLDQVCERARKNHQ